MTLPDAGALFVLLLRVTAILAVTWAVARSLRGISAALRHALWVTGLGAALLVPVVAVVLPPIHLPLPAILIPGRPAQISEGAVRSVDAAPTPEAGPGIGGSDEPVPTAEAEVSRIRLPEMNWAGWVIAFWLGGGLLRLAWLALLHSRTRRLTSRARPLSGHSRVQPLVDECARVLRIRQKIPVLTSTDVRMPLAWGVLRPVILLPADALRWSDERLRIVLLHELAHVRRRDYGTSLLSELVCVLYWPTPLVWLARRQLRSEQERACDDMVLSLGTPALAYADHILAIARDFYGSRRDLEVVVTMAREVSLKRRVRAILDDGTDRRPLRPAGGVALSMAALALYLPLGAVSGKPIASPGTSAVPTMVDPSAAHLPADGGPVYLWVEAEAGAGSDAYPGGDLDASRAQYVLLDPTGGQAASLNFETTLAASGEYFVWARASARAGAMRALTMTIEGEGTRWAGIAEFDPGYKPGDWRWLQVRAAPRTRFAGVTGVTLGMGQHFFEVASTNDEVRVDRIFLTTDASYTPEAKGPGPEVQPAYLLIEAEDGVQAGRIRAGRDAHASGNSFVVLRKGRGASVDGSIEFGLDIPQTGRYLIWGRTYAKNEESNSFHVSLDNGPEVIWDVPAADEKDPERDWSWDPVSARGTVRMDPLPFDIAAGSHTLRVRAREGGAHLDALLVTNDLDNRPEGLWPETLPADPTWLELGPERATVSGPIAVTALGDGRPHLFVEGVGRAKAPGRSGSASFAFDAVETGLYSVWARTLASSSDQDSFWIRVDNGDWVLWNGIPQSAEWNWAPVRDTDADGRLLQFHLEPGFHTIEIAGREAGLRLDRLLVTNDPIFKPS